jgi:hypothetical protein
MTSPSPGKDAASDTAPVEESATGFDAEAGQKAPSKQTDAPSKRADNPAPRGAPIDVSIPAAFYHAMSRELATVREMMGSAARTQRAAELAADQESQWPTEGEAEEQGPLPASAGDEDLLNQLALEACGRSIEWIQEEFRDELKREQPVRSEELRAAAAILSAHAHDRLDRLSVVFDLIIGAPTRKELARRALHEETSGDTDES